jgi:hypothetical protein
MKKESCFLRLVPLLVCGMFAVSACDSGDKAVDEITGNRAVKQYHKSAKDVEKIADQQTSRYQNIPEDEEDKAKKE